jgi:hypothetical protein
MRFLVILAIIILIFWVAGKLARFALLRWLQKSFPMPTPQAKGSDSEKLVQCATCQTFLPLSKAIEAKARYFCCQEHARSAN